MRVTFYDVSADFFRWRLAIDVDGSGRWRTWSRLDAWLTESSADRFLGVSSAIEAKAWQDVRAFFLWSWPDILVRLRGMLDAGEAAP